MAASHTPRSEPRPTPRLSADAWSWLAGFAGVLVALAAYHWLPDAQALNSRAEPPVAASAPGAKP